MASMEQVILPSEAEGYVECLKRFDIKDIGGKQWARQHEFLEKLNMQAVLSASTNSDEFVKEFFLTYEKLPLLIEDLLMTEIWKEKIFTEIIELKFKPKLSFPIYIILYHEAILANLLETLLFHKECAEAAEDVLLDLVDYCHRKITTRIGSQNEDKAEVDDPSSKVCDFENCLEELQHQSKTLEFDILVKVVSVLHYVIDHIDSLPLSVMTRLLNTYDSPLLFLTLIEHPPWTKRLDGDGRQVKKYIDNKWVDVSWEDSFKLTKTEGQVWIAMFQLLMNQNCQQKYELNNYRKNMLLKLRSYMNEVLLDQLPALCELQRYLEHLTIMEPPATKRDLILEQLPEIRDKIMRDYSGQWRKIAKKQIKSFFSCDDDMKEQAKRWAETYSSSMIEELISEPPKCATCGDVATKRCSRCENEWYCRRECQVGHWPKHKKVCNMMKDTMNKLQQQSLS